jgi:uncharacterized membrane protein
MVSYKRHLVKTVTYRILGTLTTVIAAYIIGGSLKVASLLGLGELVLKPVIYFLHERVWYKYIKFGLDKNGKEKHNIL